MKYVTEECVNLTQYCDAYMRLAGACEEGRSYNLAPLCTRAARLSAPPAAFSHLIAPTLLSRTLGNSVKVLC